MPETEKKRRNAPQTAQMSDIAPQPERQETEIDLLELFYYLLGHIWQLAGAVVAGAIIFLLVSVPVSYTHLARAIHADRGSVHRLLRCTALPCPFRPSRQGRIHITLRHHVSSRAPSKWTVVL